MRLQDVGGGAASPVYAKLRRGWPHAAGYEKPAPPDGTVKNLENRDCLDILIGDYNTLEERFAQIDRSLVKTELAAGLA